MRRTRRKTAQNQDGGQGAAESSQVEINERPEMQNTKKNRKKVTPYRRPTRDHSTHIEWTLEMNKNLYKFYVEAKSKGKGYQERMKGMWDEKYPALNNVTPKHLASQVRNMLKKNASILLTTRQKVPGVDNKNSNAYRKMWTRKLRAIKEEI